MIQYPDSRSAFADAPILVTGGCGFIGSHLVERLVALNAHVTVLDNLQAGHWSNLQSVASQLRAIEGDIRSADTMRVLIEEVQPRFVFHLAANASVPGSVQNPAYDFEANAAGTFVVLNALREADCGAQTVIASSGAVYGEPVSFPIVETDPLRPISPYGASKLSAEVTARLFTQVYGASVVIARLFNCYGPRMARFVVLDFLRKLSSRPETLEVLGTGKQVRDFTYVSDTVEGLLLLAVQGSPGEAYNISSGVNYSVTELAKQLIALSGLTGKTDIAYTGSSWVGDAQRWEVSIEKLRQVGYRPCVELPEGLEKTRHWFMETRA